MISAFSQPLCAPRVRRFGSCRRLLMPYAPESSPRKSGGCSVGVDEAQEAACGGSKVAIPAILSRLPDPVLAVRLQDCKVSTFGRALHHLDQAQAACRAAARHERQFSAVAKLRYSAHGCVLPKIGHYIFKSNSKEKCSTSGVPEPHSPTL